MKEIAYSPSRPPTSHETISLESLSSAVQVHVSPASVGAAFAFPTFFCLA